jgi:hypothetical protein
VLDLASGKDRPWLEHPTGSITRFGSFGADEAWVAIRADAAQAGPKRWYVAPWREAPVPPSEWVEATHVPEVAHHALYGDFFQFFQNGRLMTVVFDRKSRSFHAPEAVHFVPGDGAGRQPAGQPETAPSAVGVVPKPTDEFVFRGPGMIFQRQEFTSSVWLMKLPQ